VASVGQLGVVVLPVMPQRVRRLKEIAVGLDHLLDEI